MNNTVLYNATNYAEHQRVNISVVTCIFIMPQTQITDQLSNLQKKCIWMLLS